MPYRVISDLPDSVSKALPKGAQELFLKVFNAAYSSYDDEETVFKVAWAAVKKSYKKDSQGKWRKI